MTKKKKQWYVCMTISKNTLQIQYFNTKVEAEKVKNKINKIDWKYRAHVDFAWKADLYLPVSVLHGSIVTKVDNLMENVKIIA